MKQNQERIKGKDQKRPIWKRRKGIGAYHVSCECHKRCVNKRSVKFKRGGSWSFVFLNSVSITQGKQTTVALSPKTNPATGGDWTPTNVEVWSSEGIYATMSARESDRLKEGWKVILGSRLNINVEPWRGRESRSLVSKGIENITIRILEKWW